MPRSVRHRQLKTACTGKTRLELRLRNLIYAWCEVPWRVVKLADNAMEVRCETGFGMKICAPGARAVSVRHSNLQLIAVTLLVSVLIPSSSLQYPRRQMRRQPVHGQPDLCPRRPGVGRVLLLPHVSPATTVWGRRSCLVEAACQKTCAVIKHRTFACVLRMIHFPKYYDRRRRWWDL